MTRFILDRMFELQTLRLLTCVRRGVACALFAAPATLCAALACVLCYHVFRPASMLLVMEPLIGTMGDGLDRASHVLPSAELLRHLPESMALAIGMVTWAPWFSVAILHTLLRTTRFLVTCVPIFAALVLLLLTAATIGSVRTAMQRPQARWTESEFAVEHDLQMAYVKHTIQQETRLCDPLVNIVLQYAHT